MTEEKPRGLPCQDARPQFGNRYLTDESRVFEHNTCFRENVLGFLSLCKRSTLGRFWCCTSSSKVGTSHDYAQVDDVEWSSELEEDAKQKISKNSAVHLTEEERGVTLFDLDKYEGDANKYWDAFYGQHQNKFFKDRHWLFTEFPELAPSDWNGPLKVDNSGHNSGSSAETDTGIEQLNEYPGSKAKTRIFEVGCGVGNTVFPILQTNNDPSLFIYCCDFADSAIQIVKEQELYDSSRCHAFVCNVAQNEEPVFPFPDGSLDLIVLIFVLSAISPERVLLVLKRLSKLLKDGGMLLFRDYGRYDMAQLRFKSGRCLSDNFYVRGDGTRVYFFTQDEIHDLLNQAGLEKVQNIIDRRLQVNRGRQLKMYRVWVQCKYKKKLKETRVENDP